MASAARWRLYPGGTGGAGDEAGTAPAPNHGPQGINMTCETQIKGILAASWRGERVNDKVKQRSAADSAVRTLQAGCSPKQWVAREYAMSGTPWQVDALLPDKWHSTRAGLQLADHFLLNSSSTKLKAGWSLVIPPLHGCCAAPTGGP